ncbi:DUF11 domain-containing protein [Comamonas sp. 4034]|uniref:DUF11 domain-containing protein n=1 Tax=Comamonas sp. 4034 TaxID=3156455 RepID=UPI003D1FB9FC
MTTANDPATGQPYPTVNITGNPPASSWVPGRATIYANEPITIDNNVDLSTIRVTGTGGADNHAQFVVKPATLPGNVTNSTWVKATDMVAQWGTPKTDIDLSGGSLGFYYGNNTIGFALSSEPTTASAPAGVYADLEIIADCLQTPPPQPTAPLMCPAGSKAGDTVKIGPFTTNARDWKWTQRTNGSGVLETVEQPLFDTYRYRSYFNPTDLTTPTNARWISPGTTDPAGDDVPGVPYPAASGQTRAGFNAAVFMLNTPITVGNNVDLSTIKLDGKFAFDDTGDSVFVQPAGEAGAISPADLPNGYAGFASYVTPALTGFKRGQNNIGLLLDGGQFKNDCAGGLCALGALADFSVTAVCTGEPPSADLSITNTSASTSVAPGATVTYTITASNAGPTDATGATVTSTLPAALTGATWTCAGAGGGTCAASGSGNISDTVNLPVGATVTYTVTAKVAANASGSLTSTASIAAPAGVDDPTPANNSATASSVVTTPGAATPVPALDLAALALLGSLSAGIGAFALRRRQRGK